MGRNASRAFEVLRCKVSDRQKFRHVLVLLGIGAMWSFAFVYLLKKWSEN